MSPSKRKRTTRDPPGQEAALAHIDTEIERYRIIRDESLTTDQALWAVAVTSIHVLLDVRERLMGISRSNSTPIKVTAQ